MIPSHLTEKGSASRPCRLKLLNSWWMCFCCPWHEWTVVHLSYSRNQQWSACLFLAQFLLYLSIIVIMIASHLAEKGSKLKSCRLKLMNIWWMFFCCPWHEWTWIDLSYWWLSNFDPFLTIVASIRRGGVHVLTSIAGLVHVNDLNLTTQILVFPCQTCLVYAMKQFGHKPKIFRHLWIFLWVLKVFFLVHTIWPPSKVMWKWPITPDGDLID